MQTTVPQIAGSCEVNMKLVSLESTIELSYFLMVTCLVMVAQESKPNTPAQPGVEYSGMYSFLRDGEFVQLTVEDAGHLTGFISRYGERESDRGAFLDHFFKEGKLDANKVSFTTKAVHGVWFEFQGTVDRDTQKKAGEEGYYVLKGTLTEYATDQEKKTTSRAREVALKSFPQDATPPPEKRN